MSKNAVLILFVFCYFSFSLPSCAAELDSVYRFSDDYRVIASSSIRLFYPQKIENSISRIMSGFVKIRESLNHIFKGTERFEVNIVLTNHDDLVCEKINIEFDWIKLTVFEDVFVYSADSYSLNKRFAAKLSEIFTYRMMSSPQKVWIRALSIISLPEWYLKALVFNSALPQDQMTSAFLFDAVNNNRLFTLTELNGINSQTVLLKQKMLIQSCSMLRFWEETYNKEASEKLLANVWQRPGDFAKLFKKCYGISLVSAFENYKEWARQKYKIDLVSATAIPQNKTEVVANNYMMSPQIISDTEKLWVSSQNYFTETYDLFYQKDGQPIKKLAKNLHPSFFYDPDQEVIYVAKYHLNGKRQRRLSLMKITKEARSTFLTRDEGSYLPLAKKSNRLFYVSQQNGTKKINSINLALNTDIKTEYEFEPSVNPLMFALDDDCSRLVYLVENLGFSYDLFLVTLADSADSAMPSYPVLIFSSDNLISSLQIHDDKLWFLAFDENEERQVYKMSLNDNLLQKVTDYHFSILDFSVTDYEKSAILYVDSTFSSFYFQDSDISQSLIQPIAKEFEQNAQYKSKKYCSEFKTTFWRPIISEDEDGKVFGVHSYRTDRLGRNEMVLTPQYGFKSRNWGYYTSYLHRFSMLKAEIQINDTVRKRTYLDNDYFERSRSKRLAFSYPLDLASTLSVGMDFSDRKIEKSDSAIVPSMGKDHHFFAQIEHLAIRTEPFWQVFPRKGKKVKATYKRGIDLLDGSMIYDSFMLNWNQYVPITDELIFSVNTHLAQDVKYGGIRLPNDLALGNYLRVFDKSHKTGKSLRAFSLNLAKSFDVDMPDILPWIQNELFVIQAFWEAGDVKNLDRFDFHYDRGIEAFCQTLLFGRIPFLVKLGKAWENGGDRENTYISLQNYQANNFLD